MYSNDPVRRYDIPAIERLLGPVVEWRDAILDKMYPAQENGPSTSGGVTEIAGFSWPTSPGTNEGGGECHPPSFCSAALRGFTVNVV